MMEARQIISEALLRCNKCGFCLAGCPVYKTTGIESSVARGRLAILRSALDNQLKMSELKEPLFDCLTCNGCADHCPAGVSTGEIILRARAEFMKEKGQPWIQKYLFDQLLQNPDRLDRWARIMGWFQASGLSGIGKSPGIANLMGNLGKAGPIIPRIKPARSIRNESYVIENPKYKVAYFVGCAGNYFAPQVARSAIRVLAKHQVAVDFPDFVCCGMPASGYGDEKSTLAMVEKNLKAVQNLNFDAIITTCASCGSMLKKYASFFEHSSPLSSEAKKFAGKVKDISEFLVGIGLTNEIGSFKGKVTYHDPCHLGRYQKVSSQPRQVLNSIPGVEYREMAEANTCCGAAGSYFLSHYDISMKVLERKLANVANTEADILVTSCPGCSMQLSYGIKSKKLPLREMELVDLLDEAIESGKKPRQYLYEKLCNFQITHWHPMYHKFFQLY